MLKKIIFDASFVTRRNKNIEHGGAVSLKSVIQLTRDLIGEKKLVVVSPSKEIFTTSFGKSIIELGIELRHTPVAEINKGCLFDECGVFFRGLPYRNTFASGFVEDFRIYEHWHGLRGIETDQISIAKLWYYFRYYGISSVVSTSRASMRRNVRRKSYRDKLLRLSNSTIITPSQHSKFSILRTIENFGSKNIVVAGSLVRVPRADLDSDLPVKFSRFFVVISAAVLIKRAWKAIESFRRLKRHHLLEGVGLVVCGVPVGHPMRKYGCEDVQFFEYLDSNELDWILSKAIALIYPSISEGFGYPPVEAGLLGVPSICAGNTAILETAPDGCLFFASDSLGELELRMLEIYEKSDCDGFQFNKIRNSSIKIKNRNINHWEDIISQWSSLCDGDWS